MSSKIEEMIDELDDYISGCKFQPLSGNSKIIVEKDIIDNYIEQLRIKTPDEIRRFQKIISNRDAIIEDAKAKADAMLQDAAAQTNNLISESEVMQQAYAQAQAIIDGATAQAQTIVDDATADANNIRLGAMQYTDELLSNVQHIIAQAADSASARYTNLITELQKAYDTVVENRNELRSDDESDSTAADTSEHMPYNNIPSETGELPEIPEVEV